MKLTLFLLWLLNGRLVSGVSTLLAALCLTFLGACGNLGSSADSAGFHPGFAGAAANDAGAGGADLEPVPDVLSFGVQGPLKLSLKEVREITVQTSPPGSFRVRFALLDFGPDGTPADASLDTSDVQTDSDGIARVTLTASSTPATFNLQASVASKVQTLVVSVSALGYTTLRVDPSYSGHRPVTQWTATARAGTSCSKLTGTPPPDGTVIATAAPSEPLYLEHVPVGVDLAITVRAGHYLGGCANQAALTEGDGNSVLVYASDRTLNLAGTVLDLSFGPNNPEPAFDKQLKSAASLAESALSGAAKSDVSALLDAMQAQTPVPSRNGFDAARLEGNWDTVLQSAFGPGASRRLRDPVERWLSAGLATFSAPDTFVGQLRSQGSGALFELTRVAGRSPVDAGFSASFRATWSADSADTVLIGSQLSWLPSRLVTELAVAPALLEFPSATSLEDALSQSVDCVRVAEVLLAAGAIPGTALYTDCDEACALETCVNAVAATWKNARNASGSALATLSVTATGAAEVGDVAEVTQLNGSWVGELTTGTDVASVSGPLSATSSP